VPPLGDFDILTYLSKKSKHFFCFFPFLFSHSDSLFSEYYSQESILSLVSQKQARCQKAAASLLLIHRIKFVKTEGSFTGRPYVFFPNAMLRIRNVIFRARVRIPCIPSASPSA